MYRLIAINGMCMPESMDVLRVLVRSEETGQYLVVGGAKEKAAGLSDGTHPDEDEAMIASTCRDLRPSGILLTPDDPARMVAVWVGRGFRQRCRLLGAPEPPCPSYARELKPRPGEGPQPGDDPGSAPAHSGHWWLEGAVQAFKRLEDWTHEAAHVALRTRNPELVRLMGWCLPSSEVTRAVKWHLADEGAAKGEILDWEMRTYAKRMSAEALVAQHAATVEWLLKTPA